jgi:hypothetical protein
VAAKDSWLRIGERTIPLVLALLVPVAGGLWAVYLYIQNQAEIEAKRVAEQFAQTRARLVEAQKPFLDHQFATYKDFTSVVGDRPKWDDKMFRYWRLHWGDVALVEDETVHQAKSIYGEALKQYIAVGNDDTYGKLQDASVVLTTAMRRGIQSSWTGDLGVKK